MDLTCIFDVYEVSKVEFSKPDLANFLTGCLDLEEIPFIQFNADFDVPAFIRVGETVGLQADAQSSGALRREWFIEELNVTLEGENQSYRFDTVGQFTIRLVTSIEKSVGIVRDTSFNSLTVLPVTEEFTNRRNYGELNQDELFQDVFELPNASGYYLVASKQLNILEVRKLDASGMELWRNEFPNITRNRIERLNITSLGNQKILISGGTRVSSSENDAFILELEDVGDGAVISWQQVISSVESERYVEAFPFTRTNNIGYYAVGSVSSGGRSTILIDRFDLNGELLSSSAWEDVCANCNVENALVLPVEGTNRLIISGQESGSPALFEFTADDEELQFRDKLVLDQFEGIARNVIQLSDGELLVVGELNQSFSNISEAFAARLEVIDQEVVPLWFTSLAIFEDYFNDVQEDENGDLWATGVHTNPLSNEDVLLARFDSFTGDLEEFRLLGSNVSEGASRIILQNGTPMVFGSIENNTVVGLRDIHISQ